MLGVFWTEAAVIRAASGSWPVDSDVLGRLLRAPPILKPRLSPPDGLSEMTVLRAGAGQKDLISSAVNISLKNRQADWTKTLGDRQDRPIF
jgi:hypothetical protein